MDKTAIKNFAIEARKILMKSAITEAGFYGVTKDGCKSPVQKGSNFEVYETLAGTENRIFGDDIKRRANLVRAVEEQGFEQVIEETAYTWFNRIIAIRFMEVNNYLPTRVRVLSSEAGGGTPDIVAQADAVELNLMSEELDEIREAKKENRYDDAFRLLFIKQCNELNAILPGLFEKTDDYMELLLKISYTSDGVIRMLIDSIPEDNFNVETEGQVEIIGWMYQYYNTELKDDTFAKLKKNVKITKERIPAATQLFTPDWIVRYMVENSLGRVWIEHLRAINPSVDEKAKAEEFGWKYYLPEADQEEDVQTQLIEIRKSYKDLTPQDITCIDPCMGSGHILVYMFEVLMDIYRSEGFSEREAVFDILEKNIRGLDIDRRAYQLSYFALMMKARGYNRIFFRGHEDINGNRVSVAPKVYAIEESNSIERDQLQYYGANLDEMQKNNAINQMNGLLDTLRDAKEYGSILNIDNYDWILLRRFVDKFDDGGQVSFASFSAGQSQQLLRTLINIGEIMSCKYDSVVTNPPYMSGNNMNTKLSAFLREYYPDYKSDLFSAFIVRCGCFGSEKGYLGFLSPYVWMFIQSYEKLREYICETRNIQSLIQFEYSAFEEATVPICSFILQTRKIQGKRGVYLRLSDFKGGMEVQKAKTLEAIESLDCEYKYETNTENFEIIPSMPIAYWVGSHTFKAFKSDKLGKYYTIRNGISTGDNERYLRLWFEVSRTNKDWQPCNKGGAYRKWYGNNDYVVWWKNDGKDIKTSLDEKGRIKARLGGVEHSFEKAIEMSRITSGKLGFRFSEGGFVYESTTNDIFVSSNEEAFELLGYCNSKLVADHFLKLMNPTINIMPEDIRKLPYIRVDNTRIVELVSDNVACSKNDWDSFETSWDFKSHPLIRIINDNLSKFDNNNILIADCFSCWVKECEERFYQVKDNEEELNRVFINVYGLDDEITPEIDDKDITVRKADLGREIVSLISYAVGCMVGRYSLVEDGLICAGEPFDASRYGKYSADKDAIIPITDEQYFDDDIVGRFEEFIRIVFGERSLEENLDFIADNLRSKGSTSREKIRNYFLNDYFKDHCTMYSVSGSGKRPIYWLFDSGKQNGFKCLIYLHRYTPDTVGLIRSDYLTKTQSMIENALKNAEYTINTSSSAVDRAQATKKRDKYIKQLAEIRAYYPALSHIALQRIDLDLNDGVKANYEKFQGIEVSVEGEKKQKIDLLAKI